MGLLNIVGTGLENVEGILEKGTPSLSCVVNEVEMALRFNNFTCKNVKSADDHKTAYDYLTCITSLLLMNITDISSAKNCSGVEFGPIGELFADCQWCTEKYGCFQVGGSFISLCHPVSLPPQPLPCLDLKLQLYTSLNPYPNPQLLNTNLSNINETNFKKDLKTMILIGGWIEGDFQPYTQLLIDAALKLDNFNVILFNWNKGSGSLYGQSAANTRLLGRMLAYILRDLQTKWEYPLANVHVVGHSLGAQLAGYAGKELRVLGLADNNDYTIGRITGLDPAGPYYDCEEGPVRLDKSDATFVDVIHTNAGVFGDVVSNGHVDFKPNGGTHQPGCDIVNLILAPELEDKVFCSHTKSVHFFACSMDPGSGNCTFEAYMCENYEDFKAGMCNIDCGENKCACAKMGYQAIAYFESGCPLPAEQSFYLNIAAAPIAPIL